MGQDAVSYFQNLSALMIQTKVTNQKDISIPLEEGIRRVIDEILQNGRKVMVIGNGGSAAIASHVHNDLCKAVGVRALVFNELPLLTALSNDHGYGRVFEKPVRLWAEPNDLLFAISSSGQSENILLAVQAARDKGCAVMTFSGFSSKNPLRQMGDLNFYVPSLSYGEVEVSHLALLHFVTDRAMVAKSKMGKVASST